MTDIDSTAIPEFLAEELLDAVIEDGETHISKLGEPKIVIITPQYADATVMPTYSISGRTITFTLWDIPSTGIPDSVSGTAIHSGAVGYAVMIKGRL